MTPVNRDEAYGMIPVDREPGPWSKYLHQQVEKGKHGGHNCDKCGQVFSEYIDLINHKCSNEDELTLNRVRDDTK